MHITRIPHSTYHIAHSTYHIVLSTLMGTAYTIIACIPHCLHHHCMHTTLKAQSTSTKHISGHCLLEHASCALGGGIGIRRAPFLFSLPFSFSLPSCQKTQKKSTKERNKNAARSPQGQAVLDTRLCVARHIRMQVVFAQLLTHTHTHIQTLKYR